MSQELTLSSLKLQQVWGRSAHGHQVVSFHLVEVLASIKQLRKCASDAVMQVFQRGTKDSAIAIWLIYCLNLPVGLQFGGQLSWPQTDFQSLHVCILQSSIFETGICDPGEAVALL